MKRLLIILALLVLLTGCGITGRVVQEVEKQPTQSDNDLNALNIALAEKDVSVCYPIETQPIREQCFMLLAKELKDTSICRNLIGSLRETCVSVASN